MPMYNQLEYNQNYSTTSESLWNYYRGKMDDVYDNASGGKTFRYKTKRAPQTPKRPAQPDRDQDENQEPQPPAPALNVQVTYSTQTS